MSSYTLFGCGPFKCKPRMVMLPCTIAALVSVVVFAMIWFPVHYTPQTSEYEL
jgi:hypothetical protein